MFLMVRARMICIMPGVMIVAFRKVVFTNWDAIWSLVRGAEARQSRASVSMRMIREAGRPGGS